MSQPSLRQDALDFVPVWLISVESNIIYMKYDVVCNYSLLPCWMEDE